MKKLVMVFLLVGPLTIGCKITQCNWTKSDMSQWYNDVTQCNYATNIYCQTYGSVVTPGRVEGGGAGGGGIYSSSYTVVPPKKECASGEADRVKGDCLRMKGYEVKCEEVETNPTRKKNVSDDIPDWLKDRQGYAGYECRACGYFSRDKLTKCPVCSSTKFKKIEGITLVKEGSVQSTQQKDVQPIQEKKIVTVTSTYANIRLGAGDDTRIVATVNQGEKLNVIGELGEWLNVWLENNNQGWISKRAVK